MCVNHDHIHSIEMKFLKGRKRQTMQASTDANSEDCLSIKTRDHIYYILNIFYHLTYHPAFRMQYFVFK